MTDTLENKQEKLNTAYFKESNISRKAEENHEKPQYSRHPDLSNRKQCGNNITETS
jgi:hypothetical protein